MRLVKMLGVPLVAMFALGATTVTGASAHVFQISLLSGLVLASTALAALPQLFTTEAGHLACASLKGDGVILQSESLTRLVATSYTDCTMTALGVTAKPDEPVVVQYLFNADLTVTIEKTFTILATLAGLKCTITVKAQGPLSSVKYDNLNSNTEILVLSHVKEIESSATGAGCAKEYTSSKTGLFRGNTVIKVEGGTIKWV